MRKLRMRSGTQVEGHEETSWTRDKSDPRSGNAGDSSLDGFSDFCSGHSTFLSVRPRPLYRCARMLPILCKPR